MAQLETSSFEPNVMLLILIVIQILSIFYS